MNYKMLCWYEKEFDKACALACLYRVRLSVDQFAASRHLESEDRDALLAHLLKRQSVSV